MIRIISLLTHFLACLAGLAMLLMMFHVMADVAGKYLLHAPVPSTAEVVANYYMIAGVFLSLAWVEATGSSIAVDLIYDMVPASVQRCLYKFGQLMTMIFYLGLGWFSWDVAVRAWRVTETVDGIWRIIIWPAKFMLPLGLAIAVAVLILKIIYGQKAEIVACNTHPEHI